MLNGSLPSRPGQTYTIEFFASHVADGGEKYLGSVSAKTDAMGNATFKLSLTHGDPLGDGTLVFLIP